jgi:hypothetical protein
MYGKYNFLFKTMEAFNMKRKLHLIIMMTTVIILSMSSIVSADNSNLKKDNNFVNQNITRQLELIREQLRNRQYSLAESNIKGVTSSLERIAGNTREIRKSEPGYTPNPPIDFDNTPAASRYDEYLEARTIAIEAGKQINADYDEANKNLLKAKERQLKTISIVMVKFTIDNAPGAGNSVVVESVKKLNSYLMEKYISEPIAGFTEVSLLQNNFISIRDGEKLLAHMDQVRRKVLNYAQEMNQEMKQLNSASAAEKEWQKYRWLQESGAQQLTVQLVDYKPRDFELLINGTPVSSLGKTATFTIPVNVSLAARVKCERRAFCRERKEYAKTTKTIVVHPGPGGGLEDSLIFSSTTIPAKTSWLIKEESFQWKPSFNTDIEDNPAAVTGDYWKKNQAGVLWKISAKPGETINVYVTGKITWEMERNLRGNVTKQTETNDGSATLVLKVIR